MSAVSATDAWAVGDYTHNRMYKTLILHWNGRTWSKVPSPNPSASFNRLDGVSADSATDAWAVGDFASPRSTSKTLTLHWNGRRWSRVMSPNFSSFINGLSGVSADSATDAWAVGVHAMDSTGTVKSLILHWNGTGWSKVPSPSPGVNDNELFAVTTLSPTDAWAVGNADHDTLVLQWNGTVWSRVSSPSPGRNDQLFGVGADSAANAWAVGSVAILHWNGSAWSRVRFARMNGVGPVSEADAWAVGAFVLPGPAFKTRVLHWNGTDWSRVRSPSPGSSSNLAGVSADSATDAWAVGDFVKPSTGATDTLIVHWNGITWSRS